jgi:outer membrane immunogenic protein
MSKPFMKARSPARRRAPIVALFAATALLACVSIAAAADLPVKTAPPPAAPPYQWTGCYFGLNGGGGGDGSDFRTSVGGGTYLVAADAAEVSNDGTGSRNSSNFLGGGQAGCNLQTGTVVYGIEGDFDYFHSTTSYFNNTNVLPVAGIPFTIGQSLTTDFLATVRPRIGIAADRNFGYLTAGGAFSHVAYAETYTDAAGGIGSATGSKSIAGWTVGAGWEYAWTDHWLVRFEYLFADFPKTSVSASGVIAVPGASNPLSGSASLVMQVARAGLSFKF